MSNPREMYPDYARSERIADGVVHAIGLCFALFGTLTLIILASSGLGSAQFVALTIYGLALIASFTASAFYHFTPLEHWRQTLRRVDHAAIYFMISGTYTPLVVLIGTGFSYALLAVIWVLAIGGAIRKVFFWQIPGRFGPALYLVMGWSSLVLVWSLFPVLPRSAILLIVLGGGLYTIGVLFFSWERLKFSMAIWHGFVLTASACMFSAIFLGSFAG